MSIRSAFAISLFVLSTVAGCGDDGGSTSPDAAVDAPGGSLSCTSYCQTIQTNCTAAATKQYNDADQCERTCAFMPVGAMSDTQGNTLGCRLYHAGAPAAGNPTMHCAHGGPGGAGACGMNCAGFCQLVMGACTGANQQFGGNLATCMTECAAFADTAPYSTTAQSGNSLACRLYHATVASSAPAVHCAHVATTSPVCR